MRDIFSLQPQLDNPGAYPQDKWFEQSTKYWQWFYHFDGGLFDETVGDSEKYPLKLNIFKMAAMLHAAFLFGEVPDGCEPLVQCQIEPWGQNNAAAEYDLGRKLSDIVNRAWYENDGREIQQINGIISQVAGGCVFDVAADSGRGDAGLLAVRIGTTMPYYFFPVWSPTNYRRLLEAIVTFNISGLQAREYGVSVEDVTNNAQYQESWAEAKYKITVNGEIVTFRGMRMAGVPLGHIVPYTYIPHIRTGEFYGESLFEDKDSLAKEVNARMADLGDIVADNARQMPFIWNSKRPTIRRLRRTMPVVDLGEQMPGMPDAPGVQFPSGSGASPATVQYASNLLSVARTQAYTPDVVYGLDEGSQRSYLTLAVRMIPLIAHIRQERTHWTVGLAQVARNILRVCAEKNIEGVKPEDLQHLKIWMDWAPMLPRDREAELNEIILRFNANLITLEQALQKLGDVQDVKTAITLIKEWMKEKAELESSGQQNPFGGAGAEGTQAGLSRPSEPQANITKGE